MATKDTPSSPPADAGTDYIVRTGSIDDTVRGTWVNTTDPQRSHWEWPFLLRTGAISRPDANEREAHAAEVAAAPPVTANAEHAAVLRGEPPEAAAGVPIPIHPSPGAVRV